MERRLGRVGLALGVTTALLGGAGSGVHSAVGRGERGTGVGLIVAAARARPEAQRAPAARGGYGTLSSRRYGTLPSARYGTIRPGPSAGAGAAPEPPAGSLRSLPSEARRIMHQDRPYYFSSGYWYAPAYYGFDVYYYPVTPPIGAVVAFVPLPAQWVLRGNARFLYSHGVYYQPFNYGGFLYYRVVGMEGM